MTFQTSPPGANLVNEYLASSIPFLTSSSFLSASSAIEISFPYVASFVNVYNSSPTGSLAVAFAAPGINTSAHFDVAPGTSESFPVRCTSVFLGASAGAAQSYSLAAGLTGIQVRDNNFYAYSPADEGGLVGEWDARKLIYSDITCTSIASAAQPVASWTNLVSNNHAIQSTVSSRPIYDPDGLSAGKPAIVFDGVDDDMSSTSQVVLPGGTIFILSKRTSAPLYSGFIKHASSNIATTGNGVIFYTGASYNNALIGTPWTTWYNTLTNTGTLGDIELFVYQWGTPNSYSALVRKNGVNLSLTGPTGTYSTNTTPMNLYFANGYGSSRSGIKMSHVLVYNTVLSLSAIKRIEAYLSDQWGLGI